MTSKSTFYKPTYDVGSHPHRNYSALSRERTKREIIQPYLAKRWDTDTARISHYETGRRQLPAELALDIANEWGLDHAATIELLASNYSGLAHRSITVQTYPVTPTQAREIAAQNIASTLPSDSDIAKIRIEILKHTHLAHHENHNW